MIIMELLDQVILKLVKETLHLVLFSMENKELQLNKFSTIQLLSGLMVDQDLPVN